MADTIASTWVEPTTGLKIPILTGPIPRVFDQWMKDIKLVAESKDLWILISPESFAKADHEEILSRPVKPTKPKPSDPYEASVYRPTMSYEGMKDKANHDPRERLDDYRVDVAEYTLDLAEYEKQQKRLREARTLLLATVTSHIRDSVSDKALPHEIMAEVKAYCRPTEMYRSSSATRSQTASSSTLKPTTASPPSPTFSTNSSIWSDFTLKD